MWIIPKNYQLYSAFAQDMVESKEDLTLPGLDIESSLMWRSKPTQLKTWQGRWKRVSWMPHLYTRILKPFQQKSFETKLASSLEDIHVSHFQEQAREKAKTTQDTYGPQLGDTSNQLDLLDACSKMSKDTSRLDSPQSLAIWKKMVTEQRGDYSQRVKLAQDIREKEYLSWPTPTVNGNYNRVGASENSGDGLATAVKKDQENWPTPSARDYKGGSGTIVEEDGKFYRISNTTQNRYGARLDAVVEHIQKKDTKGKDDREMWATPNTMDHLPPKSPEAVERQATTVRKGRKRPSNLREQVDPTTCEIYKLNWPTPRASDSTGGPVLTEYNNGFRSYRHDSKKWFGAKLKDAVEMFPTPDAIESEKYRLNGDSQASKCLSALAKKGKLQNLPTPTTRDYKGGYKEDSLIRKDGKSRRFNLLPNAAIGGVGTDTIKGSLNPYWVESLMGIPQGWTDLEMTESDLGWHDEIDWIDDAWEIGIPRVIDGCDNRIDRIRLLGNGVVPSTACKAWQVLSERLSHG